MYAVMLRLVVVFVILVLRLAGQKEYRELVTRGMQAHQHDQHGEAVNLRRLRTSRR